MFEAETFWSAIGHQLRCPSGRAGLLTGQAMRLVNKEPNRLAVNALKIEPADTVLELGFGPGSAIQAMAAAAYQGLVLGIDRSPEMLAQATRRNKHAIREGRVQLFLGRFDELPWPAGSIGKVLAVNVVYFFQKDDREIREARRVLRPGGLIAIYATDEATMSRWRFAGSDTHALYSEGELRALLLSGGFNTEEVSIRSVTLAFGIGGLLALAQKTSETAS